MGGDGQNKGRGRGPPRSEEERKRARQVNAARAAEGLASKCTGSVSRSKARALAHGASIDSKFIPGEVIGPPAVRPPPPKAPTRAPVVLLEAQPRSGGNSPQHEGPSVPVVLTELGQFLHYTMAAQRQTSQTLSCCRCW